MLSSTRFALAAARQGTLLALRRASSPMRFKHHLQQSTAAVAGASQTTVLDPYRASATPLYQTATFDTPLDGTAVYDYTRSGNPTRDVLQQAITSIERGATSAYCFSTGMAALSAVLRSCTVAGDRVVVCQDLYGGTHRLLSHAARANNIRVHFADLSTEQSIWRAIGPDTKLVLIEAVSNPMMDVLDVKKICEQAQRVGAKVCVDNTMLSPLLMSPLELGADMVVHSATKFLSGHSDTMAGVVAVKDAAVGQQIGFLQNAEGTALSPFDSFMVARGIKTLPLRMEQQQKNACLIYDFLNNHPCVDAVHYLHPELETAQAKTHYQQARGPGSVLSFAPKGDCETFSRRLLDATKLFKTSVSFGSVHSLIEMPCLQSHASIASDERSLPKSLVRLSVGTEDVKDLLTDLAEAINVAARESEQLSALNDLQSHELGIPLPPSELQHATGCCMPTWRDVIGYEEGDERVTSKLITGYPRFIYPPPVRKLIELLTEKYAPENHTCLPVTSACVALRLQRFIQDHCAPEIVDVRVHDSGINGVCAVTLPEDKAGVAKMFWQHSGELVSSRLALCTLEEMQRSKIEADSGFAQRPTGQTLLSTRRAVHHSGGYARQQLRERVAGLVGVRADNVSLYSSGMASLSSMSRLVQRSLLGGNVSELGLVPALTAHSQDLPSQRPTSLPPRFAVFGFSYLDTLKLLQRPELSPGAVLVADGNIDKLEDMLEREKALAIVTEVPSNPLLQTPDLARLRALADKHECPLIVDDTVGNFGNVSVLGPNGADIQVSSLTKVFSGRGNVMGGAMVLNPHSRYYESFANVMAHQHSEPLFEQDARMLLGNAADFEQRNALINRSGELVADYLNSHPGVRKAYYPKYNDSRANYEKIARRDAHGNVGFGGLVSIVLEDESLAASVFDNIRAPKGPGFGTSFSLIMPYTMLAHYNELEWVKKNGVSPNLLRLWMGLEPVTQMLDALEEALSVTLTAEHIQTPHSAAK